MKSISPIVAGVAALALSTGASLAQDNAEIPAAANGQMAVTTWTDGIFEGVLDDSQKAVILSVAYQEAVALSCEGFEVDKAKMAEQLGAALPTQGMSEDDADKFQATVLFGMFGQIGGNLALAGQDFDSFCAHAADEREGGKDEPYMIWAASE